MVPTLAVTSYGFDQPMSKISLFFQQEKMYEFEQNKKNNLILYGITTKHPETSESLRTRIVNVFRDNLNIRRDVPVTRANRIHTGPEVRGCRPVLVTFETFKGN